MANNLKLDSTHDIIIGRGATRTSSFVSQLVKCRILTTLGEWALDPSLGLPWGVQIFKRGVNLTLVHNYLQDIIKNTNGVESVISLVLTPDYETRLLSVSFTGTAEAGQFTEEVTYVGN